jgi:hypothetical protein
MAARMTSRNHTYHVYHTHRVEDGVGIADEEDGAAVHEEEDAGAGATVARVERALPLRVADRRATVVECLGARGEDGAAR